MPTVPEPIIPLCPPLENRFINMNHIKKPIRHFWIGFFLLGLLQGCYPDYSPSIEKVIVLNANDNELFTYDLINSKKEILLDTGLGFPWRLTLDAAQENVFWTNVDKNLVQSLSLKTRDVTQHAIVTYPQGIALDEATGTIYIAEAGTPQILQLKKNKAIDTLAITGLSDPDNLIWDSKIKNLFWIDLGLHAVYQSKDRIRSIPLTTPDIYHPTALAYDRDQQQLYFYDQLSNEIHVLSIKSKQIHTLVKAPGKISSLKYLAEEDALYLLDITQGAILRFGLKNRSFEVIYSDPSLQFHADMGLILLKE